LPKKSVGQGHNRGTIGQGQEHKGTGSKWTDTQMDRDTDGQGLGHRRTEIGAQTDRDRDTDIQ
jgi:hypothetical protein